MNQQKDGHLREMSHKKTRPSHLFNFLKCNWRKEKAARGAGLAVSQNISYSWTNELIFKGQFSHICETVVLYLYETVCSYLWCFFINVISINFLIFTRLFFHVHETVFSYLLDSFLILIRPLSHIWVTSFFHLYSTVSHIMKLFSLIYWTVFSY